MLGLIAPRNPAHQGNSLEDELASTIDKLINWSDYFYDKKNYALSSTFEHAAHSLRDALDQFRER